MRSEPSKQANPLPEYNFSSIGDTPVKGAARCTEAQEAQANRRNNTRIMCTGTNGTSIQTLQWNKSPSSDFTWRPYVRLWTSRYPWHDSLSNMACPNTTSPLLVTLRLKVLRDAQKPKKHRPTDGIIHVSCAQAQMARQFRPCSGTSLRLLILHGAPMCASGLRDIPGTTA